MLLENSGRLVSAALGAALLVGISASPHSVTLLRWARRMAYSMDASWIAVYVESPKRLPAGSPGQGRG